MPRSCLLVVLLLGGCLERTERTPGQSPAAVDAGPAAVDAGPAAVDAGLVPVDVGPAAEDTAPAPADARPEAGDAPSSDSGPEPPALQEALAQAAPGDIVVVARGPVEGAIVVPVGVTVRAEPDAPVTVRGPGPGAAVHVLTRAGQETVVEGLEIDSRGGAGLLVTGGGVARLERLTIRCRRGFCLAAEGLERLVLREVTLLGLVDNELALRMPIPVAEEPAVGAALVSVAGLEASNVRVAGFAGLGGLLLDVVGQWSGGRVEDNIGVGLMVEGGRLDLEEVAVEGTHNCKHASCPLGSYVFGMALLPGADVTSRGLVVGSTGGIGLFQLEAAAGHTGLRVEDNRQAGVWLEGVGETEGSHFTVNGEDSRVFGNGGAGLLAIQCGALELTGTRVGGTRSIGIPCGEVCNEVMADGIQVRDLRGSLRLAGVTVDLDNDDGTGRFGLLLAGDPGPDASVRLEDVTVLGSHGAGVVTSPEMATLVDTTDVEVSPELAEGGEPPAGDLAVARRLGARPSASWVRTHGLVGEDACLTEDGQVVEGLMLLGTGMLGR